MENFWGRKLSLIPRFCSYPEKFSPWNLGTQCPLVAQASNPQKFSLGKSFFTNSQKSSSSKVSCFFLHWRSANCSYSCVSEIQVESHLSELILCYAFKHFSYLSVPSLIPRLSPTLARRAWERGYSPDKWLPILSGLWFLPGTATKMIWFHFRLGLRMRGSSMGLKWQCMRILAGPPMMVPTP